MTDIEYPHCQAAFINAIKDEGTKEEAVRWLQQTWNELCWVRKTRTQAIREAVDEERAGCAAVADRRLSIHEAVNGSEYDAAKDIATAIRSRGPQ